MSRSLATIGIAVVVAVSFLFVGAGAVAAHDGGNDIAGASGNCDDSSNGGGGSVGVDSEDGADATGPGEVQSVVEGLAHFGQERSQDGGGNSCDDHDDSHDTFDYIEVHAGPGQFCYSEDNEASQGDVSADGSDACH